MAVDDIYGNKRVYERYMANLDSMTVPVPAKDTPRKKRRYHVKNPENLEYFRKLHVHFEAEDTSYIRRNRVFSTLRLICFATELNLKDCTRTDIKGILKVMHEAYPSPKSKADFIKDLKCLWRLLFPEVDSKGEIDDELTPYAVRNLKAKVDKSKEKRRDDKIYMDDFQKVLMYYESDPCLRAYLSVAWESLGRPQELMYCRIRDVELHDTHAKIHVSSHGKEGIKFCQCIDSYKALADWLNVHPLRKDKDAFLFINNYKEQLTPFSVNKRLGKACKKLGLPTLTCYSLKRCGVTFRRLRGDSDGAIQHAAGWSSTRQLATYDKSSADDVFTLELAKRGLLKDEKLKEKYKHAWPQEKTCVFCATKNASDLLMCTQCQRPLDREQIKLEIEAKESEIEKFKREMSEVKRLFIADAKREILGTLGKN